MSNFTNSIRKHHEAANMTMDELAKQIGVTTLTISRYERGEASPSVPILLKLAEALNCSVDDLLK